MEKTNHIIYKEIADLFKARDKAILEKDKELLRSTQLKATVHMPKVTSHETTVLALAESNMNALTKVAFVKEIYMYKEYDDEQGDPYEATHEQFKIYHLINTLYGWRIAREW